MRQVSYLRRVCLRVFPGNCSHNFLKSNPPQDGRCDHGHFSGSKLSSCQVIVVGNYIDCYH